MPGTSLTSEQILTALAETPLRIAELIIGLTEAQLHAPHAAGEWSANEVLAHLRACADVWGNCIATIISQDSPTIRAVNPRTWIKSTDYVEQEFHLSLQAFTIQRTDLLAILKPLGPRVWSRAAKVTGPEKPLVRTVQSYAQWMAEHERPHVKQIKRMINTMRKYQRKRRNYKG